MNVSREFLLFPKSNPVSREWGRKKNWSRTLSEAPGFMRRLEQQQQQRRDTSRVTPHGRVNQPAGCMMGNKWRVISHPGRPDGGTGRQAALRHGQPESWYGSRPSGSVTGHAERSGRWWMVGEMFPVAKTQRTSLPGERRQIGRRPPRKPQLQLISC